MNNSELLKLTIQQYVLLRMSQDAVDEFLNMPVWGKKYRFQLRQMEGLYNTIRKKLCRQLTVSQLEAFEEFVCDMADECEDNYRHVKTMIKDSMVNKVPFQYIEPAVQLCLIGGYLDIMQEVSKRVVGRKNTHLSQITEWLEEIDVSMNIPLMNGVAPNENAVVGPFVNMFKKLNAMIGEAHKEGRLAWA